MMRILETDVLTANEDATGIGLEFSGQNVNQGALTRAIFSQERVDLARMDHTVHAFQPQGVAEAFADAASKDDRMNAHLAIRFPQEIGEFNHRFHRFEEKGVCEAKISGECGAHAWSGDIIGLAALRANNV